MKATINGITVEGTPQEIWDYQHIVDMKHREVIYIKPPLGKPPEWWSDPLGLTKVTGGFTIKGPANCAAAKQGGCNCSEFVN